MTSTSTNSGSQHQLNYKTLLCQQWLANGSCPRGNSCNFAHGTNELRTRSSDNASIPFSGRCIHTDQCNYVFGQADKFVPDDPSFPMGPGPPPTPSGSSTQQFYPVPPLFSPSIPPPPFRTSYSTQSQQNFAVSAFSGPVGAPFQMSFPPPPSPALSQHHFGGFGPMGPGPLASSLNIPWGQPPSLNSLIQPNHFQPLTRPPPTVGGPSISMMAQPPPPLPKFQSSQKAPLTHAQSRMERRELVTSLAELALKFDARELSESIFADATADIKCETTNFDTNNESDFPSLVNNESLAPKPAPPAAPLLIQKDIGEEAVFMAIKAPPQNQEPLSFAKMAARPPIASLSSSTVVSRKVSTATSNQTDKKLCNSQTLNGQDQHQHILSMAHPLNKAVTRPSPGIISSTKTISTPACNQPHKNGQDPNNDVATSPSLAQSRPLIPLQSSICSSFDDNLSSSSSSAPHNQQERVEHAESASTALDDIFNKAPYLNHLKELQAELNKSIVADQQQHEEEQWQTVTGRARGRRASAVELPHHPSPFTDDGYQEDFVWSEENSRSNTPESSIMQHGQQQMSSQLPSHSGLTKENPFWKTQICRYWRAFRDQKAPEPCRHGKQCFFAHGEKDLQKLDPFYFKTQLCEYWNQEEPCPYGEGCNFAHGEGDLRKLDTVKGPKSKPGATNRLFFNRHRVRKPRGKQTIAPFHSFGKPIEKVILVKQAKQ